MKKLYQPIMINKLELKNRIVMSPCGINNTVDGCMTDQDVAFYRRRARGGVGLIVVANLQWDKVRYNPGSGAHIIEKRTLPSLKRVTDAIHEEGGKVFADVVMYISTFFSLVSCVDYIARNRDCLKDR